MADKTTDQKPSKSAEAQQPQPKQSKAQKRGFKIPAEVDTFEECSAERKKFFGDAEGKAFFNEIYWGLARDMAVVTNNTDVQLEYIRSIKNGEDCLTRRVLLGQPNDATAEQKAAVVEEVHKRAVQGEKEKTERGQGIDDNGKWWEKFGQPVGRYKEEEGGEEAEADK